jgi:hypothetical protein
MCILMPKCRSLPFLVSGVSYGSTIRSRLPALFFCGAGHRNDNGIDNAAFAQHQSTFLQVLAHRFE